ncbi:MAG: GNAT family N-acetyltransferase [Clostridia bacterium]|nr:GNAT family N-acetyltransferase [Clostridia bacterium]
MDDAAFTIVRIDETAAERLAPLMADFRVTLRAYRGIVSEPDVPAAEEEIADFLKAGYPIFAAEEAGELAGYLVCRIETGCLWAEYFYVRPEYRRRGVGSLLFARAEEEAAALGGDTVFNFVHPNNQGMIDFLRAKGYTVLNMIEIRKPWPGEKLTSTIHVEDNAFDY